MSEQGVNKKFDEVDSAFWFEQFIRNHPRKDFTSDEARYLHSWWREGAKWKHDSCIKLIEQLEKEKALLIEALELIKDKAPWCDCMDAPSIAKYALSKLGGNK